MDAGVRIPVGAAISATEFSGLVGAFAGSVLAAVALAVALLVVYLVYRLAANWRVTSAWKRATRRQKRADLHVRESLLSDGYSDSDIDDAIEHSAR